MAHLLGKVSEEQAVKEVEEGRQGEAGRRKRRRAERTAVVDTM